MFFAYSLPFARAVGRGGVVVAIEPTDYAFSRLQANAAAASSRSGGSLAAGMRLFFRAARFERVCMLASWRLDWLAEDAVRSETVSPVDQFCDLQGDFQKLQREPILLPASSLIVSRSWKELSRT
jgi:hypothetical protein